MLEGGCFCKNVRFEMEENNYLTVDCHCTMCRRAHGAPYVTWIVVPNVHFRYTGQAPKALKSSTNGTRYFCPSCGTPIACVSTEHPDVIDIPIGSLDNPELFKPTEEIFVDTRLPWLHPL